MKINTFPGLNTIDDSYEVGLTGLVQASNVDVTRKNKIRSRKGYSLFRNSNTVTALWGDGQSALFIEGDQLFLINIDQSVHLLQSGLTKSDILSAVRAFNNSLYWCNGFENGVYKGGRSLAMGIPVPELFNIVQLTYGFMPEGQYLVSLTYLIDGIEGPLAPTVLLNGRLGFQVNLSTVPVMVDHINLYLSSVNGEELYLAKSVLASNTVVDYILDTTELGIPCTTQHLTNFPPLDMLIYYAGRLWGFKDKFVYYSESYSELIDLRSNFIPLDSAITAIGSVADGLFICTESQSFFLRGTDPNEMVMLPPSPYGAIKGTSCEVDASYLGDKTLSGKVVSWLSSKGWCIGVSGGAVYNQTQKQVKEFIGLRGASIFRRLDGQNHIISVLQN